MAVFNTRDEMTGQSAVGVVTQFAEVGLRENCRIWDVWEQKDLGTFKQEFTRPIPAHGAGLYRFSPVE